MATEHLIFNDEIPNFSSKREGDAPAKEVFSTKIATEKACYVEAAWGSNMSRPS